MTHAESLGGLIVAFMNRTGNTRGRNLRVLDEASVTVGQAILLDRVARGVATTPSQLADALGLSQPSASQMIDRLVRLGYLDRSEDPIDRRRKAIKATAKAKSLVEALNRARREDFEDGLEKLSPSTRKTLARALTAALDELA